MVIYENETPANFFKQSTNDVLFSKTFLETILSND
jgi:hypothetical protein